MSSSDDVWSAACPAGGEGISERLPRKSMLDYECLPTALPISSATRWMLRCGSAIFQTVR